MTFEPLPTLCDNNGNVILRIEAQRILDADHNLVAVVEHRTAWSPKCSLLGRVTPQGRYIEGAPREVVVVVEELRDVMGTLIGRFANATPAQRGLLALVYGKLVTDSERKF